MGMLKRRVYAEDIIINCSEDSKVGLVDSAVLTCCSYCPSQCLVLLPALAHLSLCLGTPLTMPFHRAASLPVCRFSAP
jgi:hypothetical protein